MTAGQKNFDDADLSLLPEDKRRALRTMTKSIVKFSGLTVEMILLYGSYARNDWVEDASIENGAVFEYVSDYDLMVLVEDHQQASRSSLRTRLEARLARNNPTAPDPSVEIMTVDQFNKNLRKGHYFFVDVKKEGIVLFDSGRRSLDKPAKLNPKERQERSREYFEDWYGQSLAFFNGYRFFYKTSDYRRAAFMLHQTVEGLLATFLLTLTAYRPKIHDLRKLLQLAASGYPDLVRVFPSATKEDESRFEALRNYYIDSRYTLGFKASPVDLEILSSQAETLRGVVYEQCLRRIETESPGTLPADWYSPPDFETSPAPQVELGEEVRRLESELHAKQLDLEASRKREEVERKEKEKERKEKEESLLREVEAKEREKKERAEKDKERKEKEESLKRERLERAEKERLAELLKKAGIDPDKKLK